MKTSLIVVLILLGISLSTVAAACDSPWKDGGCYQTRRDPCMTYPASCDSSDAGWRYNTCISYSEYRNAFGNIGAR
ncbi:MAG: hypothetical protein ACD_45C00628G0001 [uncultured bacterium]|nr:MAG: hypothetical protein ACD_45C00628G0001 [uncultured bacterium]OGT54182.1 MAG: hypothetical protein A3F43_01650 [Gammaproteobacteria bacterium RIFCSPHIGHO2_12_FULL_42_10]